MKHNFILLSVAFIGVMLVGCKPKDIDINDTLKQISEETFAKTPTRSYLAVVGNDFRVVEYTFDAKAKTAVRKEVNFAQKVPYIGEQKDDFTYTWGDFKEGMYGRLLQLTGGKGNLTLSYLNDQLTEGDITTSISEPRADMAANMIAGLTSGKWAGIDSTNVKELIWVDTVIYEWTLKGKKIIWDTIYMRMPRPNAYINRGIDSCFYYTYTFEKGDTAKQARLVTEFQKNIVKADTTFLTQKQDPTKFDTIVTYQVTEGTKVHRSTVDYSLWTIANITVKNDVQSLDVVLGEQGKEPVTLPLVDYQYNGVNGVFLLNDLIYFYQPKN